jgi:hypothetical protein
VQRLDAVIDTQVKALTEKLSARANTMVRCRNKMEAKMRLIILLFVLSVNLVRADWFRDPLAFAVTEDGFELREGADGFAIREELPLSHEVAVEAVFELVNPERTNSWRMAELCIHCDDRNFWALGVVKTPLGNRRALSFELAEMRDGRWLAQQSLKTAFATEQSDFDFSKGTRWQLRLVMDAEGITGYVSEIGGSELFKRRYLFDDKAVSYGRPGLRTTGLGGRFAEIKFSAGSAVDDPHIAPARFPPYSSDNFIEKIRSDATGFFYVRQFDDGRWWTIDPLGRGVVALGVDHTTFWGHWCEKLGYAPYRKKNEAKYPDPAVWERETLGRLKKWGFTMLGAGSQESLMRRGLYHCENLGIGQRFAWCGGDFYITPEEGRPCSAFPNVFHPEFADYCRYVAHKKCASLRNDPWLFGWFLDNELAWWGRGSHESGLFDAVMQFDIDHSAKQALTDYLKKRAGGDIDRFNRFWGTDCAGFDAAGKLTRLDGSTPERIAVKHDFLKVIAERYFKLTTEAIRRVDPNHMIMGARFAGTGGADPAVWEIAGRYSDVISFNCYPKADLHSGVVYSGFDADAEPVREHFERFYGYVNKPLLITEWSFPALDAGVPSVHGAGQRFMTQRGRTDATRLFARTMLSMPFVVGYNYFMWVDEPELGISSTFPEDSNYGLVNEENVPYVLITDMFTKLHDDLYDQRIAPVPAAKNELKKRTLEPMTSALKLKAMYPESKPPVVRRDGKGFVIDNGRLKLEGAVGSGCFIEKISLDGRAYGSYNAMLHSENSDGRNQWQNISEVTAVEIRMENDCVVADISGIYKGHPAFEIAHRIIIPSGGARFVIQFLRVVNNGHSDIALRGIYFLFNVAGRDWGEIVAPPRVWGVPENGCWIKPESGEYYGALASAVKPGMRVSFWQDKNDKSFHPDARYEVEKRLKPGELFRAGQDVTVIGVLGVGGRDAWTEELKNGNLLLEERVSVR